jgi:3'(2'), 5'-bisphosphate nucleotidase
MIYERELDVAIEAARTAGLLCENVRRGEVGEALEKDDRSPVTVADFGAQALICQRLQAEFADDPVVAEENSAALRTAEGAEALAKVVAYVQMDSANARPEDILAWIDHGGGEVARRYWTLDPIDGTKGFLRKDQYAVALALIENWEMRVGVLVCPQLPLHPGAAEGERGVLFSAVRGRGAESQGLASGHPTRIEVAKSTDPRTFRMVESVESAHGNHALQESVAAAAGIGAEPVRMDSQAKYGAVARGQAALYLRLPSPKTPDYRERIWDHAAGALIVEEAGGKVTDVKGTALDFRSGRRMQHNRGVVVSNGRIHARVLQELAKHF